MNLYGSGYFCTPSANLSVSLKGVKSMEIPAGNLENLKTECENDWYGILLKV